MVQELKVNRRASSIQPSATLAVSARAGELRAEGKKVLNFAAGEPDFRPPAAVTETVIERLGKERVAYAPAPGLPALRDAVAKQMSEYHDYDFGRGNVLVSVGAKHSLANFFLVTLEAGDEVIYPAPFWVSYPEMVRLGGGESVVVDTTAAQGFKLTPEALEAAITDRTKILLLNSPSNPTGVGYSAEELRALGEVLARRAPQAWILADDIYRQLTYDGYEHSSLFKVLKGVTDQIVIVDGVSKTYAMTGYRIGFMIAPPAIVNAGKAIQGQMTSGATTPAQWAALTAITDPRCQDDVAQMREAFTRRRRLVVDGLRAVKGVNVVEPDGAFYVFADVSAHVGGRHNDDIALAKWLLEEKLVATVPGTAFGAPGHLRMSFATDDDSIKDGLGRIADALGS